MQFLLGFVLFAAVLLQSVLSSGDCNCNSSDHFAALRSLYDSTNGPSWDNKSGWLDASVSMCEWHGISDSCLKIVLNQNKLSGSLPPNFLARMQHLYVFNVAENDISGTLPADPGWLDWPSVRQFNVSHNALTGTLPTQYSNWNTTIRVFDVGCNNFTGTLPPEYSRWTELEQFLAGENSLTGTLPDEYSAWTQLLILHVWYNSLNGTLPSSYASMTVLGDFTISSNRFYGTVPEEYQDWDLLRVFLVGDNLLEGTLSTSFKKWTKLIQFSIFSNQFNGTLSPEYSAWKDMRTFQVQSNRLTGTLPPSYGVWGALDTISLSRNRFVGPLPREFADWRSMIRFDVYGNLLNGTLPPEYARWNATIRQVNFNSNAFTGPLPREWAAWTNVTSLAVANNQLSSTIPPEYARLVNLDVFGVSINHLSGTLPLFLSSSSKIRLLALDSNDFTGGFPASWSSMGRFPNFMFLLLHNNRKLTGTFPPQVPLPLFVSVCNTSFCGPLPAAWSQYLCQDLSEMYSGQSMQYDDVFSNLDVLPEKPTLPVCTAAPGPTPAPPPSVPAIEQRSRKPQVRPHDVVVSASVITGGLRTAAAAGGGSAGGLLQVSLHTSAIARRLALCKVVADAATVDDSAIIGYLIADNPTRIEVSKSSGSSVSLPGGTVVGNGLLLLLVPVLFACGHAVALSIKSSSANTERRQTPTKRFRVALAKSKIVALHVYTAGVACLHVPVAAAAASLFVTSNDRGGWEAPVLGVLGTALLVAPVSSVVAGIVRVHPLKGRCLSRGTTREHRASIASRVATVVRSAFAVPRSAWKYVQDDGVCVDVLNVLLEGCHYPHSWVVVWDLVSMAMQGLLTGVASSPMSSCRSVAAATWSLFALCVVCVVIAIAVRPRVTVADCVFDVVMNVWTSVSVLAAAVGSEDEDGASAIAQSVFQVLWALPILSMTALRRCRAEDEDNPPRVGGGANDNQHGDRRKTRKEFSALPTNLRVVTLSPEELNRIHGAPTSMKPQEALLTLLKLICRK